MTDADRRGHPAGLLGDAVRDVVRPETWVVTAYLLSTGVTAWCWFTILVAGLSLGVSTIIVWVGLPVLAALLLLWRAGARLERTLTHVALGARISAPYRPTPRGALLARARVLATDPATWKDLTYLLALVPLGTLWSAATAIVWGNVLSLVTAPFYTWALPGGRVTWLGYGDSTLVLDSLPKALAATAIGLALTVPAAQVVRGMGMLHRLVAVALLGTSRAQQLAAEAMRLRASRDATLDAAAAERRRLERDLHDGAQQRLVTLAMDLGLARQKLTADPQSAVTLVERAHQEAKLAIRELRDLARGLHPAVLADRGLDAALSSLVARAPVPVEVRVELPVRPPAEVELAAYFVVAEALTNLGKHARATGARVTIARAFDRVLVQVSDDGVGGAAVQPQGGLAGMRARVEAIGGSMELTSPAGGPTEVLVELPCAW